jgi:glutaredoxin
VQKIGFLVLPILFFIYNASETYLKLNHSSLCESTGCKLADGLLKYDSIYLNYAGVLGAFLIMLLGFISYKNEKFRRYFYFVVFISLMFETIMLGYQYFASPQMCKFCMGVYAFLVSILLFSAKRYFLVALPAVLALLIALSSLKIANTAPAVIADGTYLIQSPTCPHCKKVKKYLKEHDIEFKKLDIDEARSQNFITFLGYHTIPMLIVKEDQSIKAINGDEKILEYYENRDSKVEQSQQDEQPDEEPINVDSLYGKIGGEEGCGFLPIEKEESSCDSKEKNESN